MRSLFRRLRVGTTRAASAACVMALATLAALAAQAHAQEQIERSGDAEGEIVLHDHAGWDRACTGIAPPSVRLERPPRHGTVCTRADDIRIEYIAYGTQAHCIGRTVRGVRLIYRPHPGHAGGDDVGYSVQYPKSRRDLAVRVTTLPPAPATSGASPSRAGFLPLQPPGPVPACNDFLF